MTHTEIAQIIISLFSLLTAGIGVLGIHWKMTDKNGLSIKDMLRKLEEKERELEELKIQTHAWKMRYDHAKRVCKHDLQKQ